MEFQANQHAFQLDDMLSAPQPNSEEEISFNIDTNVPTLEAFFAQSRAPRMGRDKWMKLDSEARQIWDQLSDEAKSVILGPNVSDPKGNPPSAFATRARQPPPRPPPPCKVNWTDVTLGELMQAQLHDSHIHDQDTERTHDEPTAPTADVTDVTPVSSLTEDQILAFLGAQTRPIKKAPPGDINRLMSSSLSPTKKPPPPAPNPSKKEVSIDGHTHRLINQHRILCQTSAHKTDSPNALIDRGANGGIAGDDVRVICKTGRQVDIQGIDNHRLTDIPIVTAGGVVKSQRGSVIVILNQFAHTGKGKTILSSPQLEWHKVLVDDKSRKVGGKQCLITPDNCVLPLDFKSGLACLPLRPHTDKEWEQLPHVVLTSDVDWDPSVLDNTLTDDDEWLQAQADHPNGIVDSNIDEFGEFLSLQDQQDPPPDDTVVPDPEVFYQAHLHELTPSKPNLEKLQPHFAWQPLDTIKRTLEATTQIHQMPMSTHPHKAFKSPFPGLNCAPKRRTSCH